MAQTVTSPAQTMSFEPLTPLMAVRLAAPHTWPGPAVLTTVFGGVYAIACGYDFSPLIWCLLLAVAVFAQSAVNTLNDWADYRAGTDTVENSDDPTDAVLVYNNPNPRSVLVLGLAYMLVALICGTSCVIWSGSAIPLVIGVVGALFIVCYSSGKLPISYFPLGELVSGIVMGRAHPACRYLRLRRACVSGCRTLRHTLACRLATPRLVVLRLSLSASVWSWLPRTTAISNAMFP